MARMSDPKQETSLREGAAGRSVHDVGGLSLGTIDRDEHDLSLWEKRTDALLVLLVGPKKAAFNVDALRRMIESYSEQEYDRTTYYEKWVRAIRNLLIEQSVITSAELDTQVAKVRAAMKAEGRSAQSWCLEAA